MDDSQLLRYSRHILLDEIGIEGQQKLLDARVLVIGAGGLGSPAEARYMAAGEPRPPAPITNARASSSFCWPSMPISSSRMWRE